VFSATVSSKIDKQHAQKPEARPEAPRAPQKPEVRGQQTKTEDKTCLGELTLTPGIEETALLADTATARRERRPALIRRRALPGEG
jgi:hypothetical protein